MIQRFDFTKKNPKLVFICTGEQTLSQEDAILCAYLNRIGFDIVLFVPTGYRVVEQYFNGNVFVEHQIGDYMYDLAVPPLDRNSGLAGLRSLKDRFLNGIRR